MFEEIVRDFPASSMSRRVLDDINPNSEVWFVIAITFFAIATRSQPMFRFHKFDQINGQTFDVFLKNQFLHFVNDAFAEGIHSYIVGAGSVLFIDVLGFLSPFRGVW